MPFDILLRYGGTADAKGNMVHRRETVEIACDFQHEDIVWVEENGERMVGRVVDLRMRVLLPDLPIDDMFSAKPKNYQQYVLVVFFDNASTW
ncbi:unnamed protein product [Gongylonema pulchrum]|uniref:Tudor domain-containing protein n=2 Tax=Gongylonema pulchrum TaxID=637853 RepID=A0A183E9S9_9BILA|nr:unnamed protein product [Gongylonema pulchrum]